MTSNAGRGGLSRGARTLRLSTRKIVDFESRWKWISHWRGHTYCSAGYPHNNASGTWCHALPTTRLWQVLLVAAVVLVFFFVANTNTHKSKQRRNIYAEVRMRRIYMCGQAFDAAPSESNQICVSWPVYNAKGTDEECLRSFSSVDE